MGMTKEYERDLIKGRKVAEQNGMKFSCFKNEISKDVDLDNDEDQWVFDYQSYLLSISTGNFDSPKNWAKEYYQHGLFSE